MSTSRRTRRFGRPDQRLKLSNICNTSETAFYTRRSLRVFGVLRKRIANRGCEGGTVLE
jgi:hypothetical protein